MPSNVLDYRMKDTSNYNGKFAKDVKAFAKKMEVAKADGDKKLNSKFTDELVAAIMSKPSKNVASAPVSINSDYPQIGMTSNEVLNTYWGKPDKVNRTTTAYGTSEQWVYGISKYVYLENGKVTAIQDY